MAITTKDVNSFNNVSRSSNSIAAFDKNKSTKSNEEKDDNYQMNDTITRLNTNSLPQKATLNNQFILKLYKDNNTSFPSDEGDEKDEEEDEEEEQKDMLRIRNAVAKS